MLKKKTKSLLTEKPHTYKISISDQWVEYEYELTLTNNCCIEKIAKKIFRAYKKRFKQGKLRKELANNYKENKENKGL